MTVLLDIYLNDHLAGAVGGTELARRTAGANRSSPYGSLLAQLADEIDSDRRALRDIMRALGVRVDPLKVAGGWTAEKVGRLKPNGRLTGYSPLSRVLEIEALILGVRAKLSLWRNLMRLELPALEEFDLGELGRRAERQLERLEEARPRAAADAFEGEHRHPPRARAPQDA